MSTTAPGPVPVPTESVLTTIKREITAAWGIVETDATEIIKAGLTEVEGAAQNVWTFLKTTVTALGAGEWQIIMDLVARAKLDFSGGKSIEALESDLLNTAEAEELALLEKAGSGFLQVVIAQFRFNALP